MDLSLTETIADRSARVNRSVLAPFFDAETQPHLPNPNMAKLTGLAQQINATPQLGAEAVRGIRDRIDNREPKVRLLTLMCLDVLIRNCTPSFHAEVAASRPLLHDILAIATCGAQIATPEHPVQQHALQLILNCSHWFRPDARQGDERLKPLADLADIVRRTQCTLFHGMEPDTSAVIQRRDLTTNVPGAPLWPTAAPPMQFARGNSWAAPPPSQPYAQQYAPAVPNQAYAPQYATAVPNQSYAPQYASMVPGPPYGQPFMQQPYQTGAVVQGHRPSSYYVPNANVGAMQTGVVEYPPVRTVRTPPPAAPSFSPTSAAPQAPVVVLIPPTEQQIGEMMESLSLMSEMLVEVRDTTQRRSSAVDEVLQSVAAQVGTQHTRLNSFIKASSGAPLANGEVLRSIANSQSEVLAKYRNAKATASGVPTPEPPAERPAATALGAEVATQPLRIEEVSRLASDVFVINATSPREAEAEEPVRVASPSSPQNPFERLPFANAPAEQRRAASYGTL